MIPFLRRWGGRGKHGINYSFLSEGEEDVVKADNLGSEFDFYLEVETRRRNRGKGSYPSLVRRSQTSLLRIGPKVPGVRLRFSRKR